MRAPASMPFSLSRDCCQRTVTVTVVVFVASVARDWFYAFAKCDFDLDGVFWEFTVGHFTSDVSMGDTNFGE